ncbi:hypothetical protein KM800_00020 [Clostridium tyrobutyricum]|uniref:hypothetical protein n=1 Tax=Clostridium tyrobutyricum TaxID=1519 RepID=UPI001C382D58|nr:hypothetical protein [Clostridium tyrobutyricum]MBV4417717.1 hypothetical protein [Clostridium tyrobutyricum]
MSNAIKKLIILLWIGFVSVIGNTISEKVPLKISFIGMGILVAVTIVGIIIKKIIPIKLPVVFWVSVVAVLLTSPINPYGAFLDKEYLGKISMLALTTPVLAFAGLSLGKDIKMFKNLSWKIVVVALTVYTGTFVFASIIAEIVLRLEHQI